MEDEERQKKVEVGRVKFSAYQKKKNNALNNEQKKKKKVENEEGRVECAAASSSTLSFEELPVPFNGSDEADSSESDEAKYIERLECRITELEALVEGKEEKLKVALQEAEKKLHVEVEYKNQLEGCRQRLEEFQNAVEKRDGLLKQLTDSFHQALQSREEMQHESEQLAQEVMTLRRQLQATVEMLKTTHKSQYEYAMLQNKMLELEDIAQKQTSFIEELKKQVEEQQVYLQMKDTELEKKSVEFADYKTKSSLEIQTLMRDVEKQHQIVAQKTGIEKILTERLSNLHAELEEHFGLQLGQIKEKHRMQFNEELEALKKKHAEEIVNLSSSSVSSNSTQQGVESLENEIAELNQQINELSSSKEAFLSEVTKYKEKVLELSEEIKLVVRTKEEIEMKLSAQTVTFEKSVSSYKQQINDLNNQLKEYKSETAQEIEMLRQSQVMEVSEWRKRVDLLNEELQKVSEIAQSHLLRLENTSKVHEAELNSISMAHAQELSFLTEQLTGMKSLQQEYTILQVKLKEKSELQERLEGELQESIRNEEQLKEKLFTLRNELENIKTSSETSYKEQIDILNQQLQEKFRLEEELRADILQKNENEEVLRKTLAKVQEEIVILKKTGNDLNIQVESLTLQLKTSLEKEEKIKQEYENHLKIHMENVTKEQNSFDLKIEQLDRELQDIKEKFTIEQKKNEDAERALQDKVNEIKSLSYDNEMYEHKLEDLQTRMKEKEMIEEQMKVQLTKCREEMEILKENLQRMESLNMQLEERLKTEQKMQDELIAAGKAHKQQIEQLSAKISELTSQQNSLDNEAISLRKELQDQKTYIKNLEMMNDQVSESSKTKEELINDLSVCISSLTEDNTSYKLKLDNLNRRLDDESDRASEHLKQRELYEEEVTKHKQRIEDLSKKLEEASCAKDAHLAEISNYLAELNGYKEQLESLNTIFITELKRAQDNFVIQLKEKDEELKSANSLISEIKAQLTSKNEELTDLNKKFNETHKLQLDYEAKLSSSSKQIEDLNNQILEITSMKKDQQEEFILYERQLEAIGCKLKETEQKHSQELSSNMMMTNDLEKQLHSKEQHIEALTKCIDEEKKTNGTLNDQVSELTTKMNEVEQKRLQDIRNLEETEKKHAEKLFNISETHQQVVAELHSQIEILKTELQNLSLEHQNCLLQNEQSDICEESVSKTELNSECSKTCVSETGSDVLKSNTCLQQTEELTLAADQAESQKSEITQLKEELANLNTKFEEQTKTYENCLKINKTFQKEIRDANSLLSVKEAELQNNMHALSVCQAELTQIHENMELCKSNLKKEAGLLFSELQKIVTLCAPYVKDEIEYNPIYSDQVQQLETSMDDVDSNVSLEKSMYQLLLVHKYIQSLLKNYDAMNEKCSDYDEIFSDTKEIEHSLQIQIEKLNNLCQITKEEKEQMKVMLEETTVKYLTAQSLLAGKEEAEKSIQREAQILEEKFRETYAHMKSDNEHLTYKVSCLGDVVKKMEEQKRELMEKCTDLERNLESSVQEKEHLQKTLDDIKVQVENAKLFDKKVSDMEETLKKLQQDKEKIAVDLQEIRDKYHGLLTEKHTSDEVVKDLRKQIARLQENVHEGEQELEQCKSLENNSLEKSCKDLVVKELRAEVIRLQEIEANWISAFNNESQSSIPLETDVSLSGFMEYQECGTGDFNKEQRVSRSSPLSLLQWMSKYSALEYEKKELAAECDMLKSHLKERENQENILNEEITTVQEHCEKLRMKLIELERKESNMENIIQVKLSFECQIQTLECENAVLKQTEDSIRKELIAKQIEYEEKLKKKLQLELCSEEGTNDVEKLILELSEKSKELIMLREQVKSEQHTVQTLKAKIAVLEMSKENAMKQFQLFRNEVSQSHQKLEDAWQEHKETESELGRARKELVLLQLRRDQLEASQNRLSDIGLPTDINGSILTMQQEVHKMVEDLAAEVVTLKCALQSEKARSEKLALEVKDEGLLEVQQKLDVILKSNAELIAEKEALLEKLKEQRELLGKMQENDKEHLTTVLCNQQAELMEQLSAYREHHTSLFEVVDSTGLLQETLRQQKEELLIKMQEKANVEQQLVEQNAELKNTQIKLQLLEQQLLEKDHIEQELRRQKNALESDLHEIEDRLRDQIDALQSQKLNLEAEIRNRDLHLRHWQLQMRVKDVQNKMDSSFNHSQSNPDSSVLEEQDDAGALKDHLQAVRAELDEAHSKAVARLKHHLNEQFSLRESRLQANFSSELSALQFAHDEELSGLRQELLEMRKEIENLKNKELHNELGVNKVHITDIADIKAKHENEIENICTGLEEEQVQLFALLKHKFEEFTQQVIACSIKKFKDDQEVSLQQEIDSLRKKHEQEITLLRAQLEKEKQLALLTVHEEFSKKYEKQLSSLKEREKKCELSPKAVDTHDLHRANSSQAAMVQLKHLLYSEYTTALRDLTNSWDKKWQEEIATLLSDVQKTLENEAESLKEQWDSLESSDNKEYSKIIVSLSSVEQLINCAEETVNKKLEASQRILQKVEERLEFMYSKVAHKIEHLQEAALNNNLEVQVEEITKERDNYRHSVEMLSSEHTTEVSKLQELVTELEAKHEREMEKLRCYFEQKVADVGKNYSEEITSHHSCHVSDSSCESDSEFVADMYYGSGDHAPLIPTLTHICDTYISEPKYKELEEHYRKDFEKRIIKYKDQLEVSKQELELKYEGELQALRDEYDEKVEKLVRELTGSHQNTVRNIEVKHNAQLEMLKKCWETEVKAAYEDLIVSAQVDKTQLPLMVSAEYSEGEEKLQLDQIPENKDKLTKANEELKKDLKNQILQLKYVYERILEIRIQQEVVKLKDQEKVHLKELKEELEEAHAAEMQRLEQFHNETIMEQASTASVNAAIKKVQKEEIIRQEIRHELECELEKKVEEIVSFMKSNSEREQVTFIETQNQIMQEFLEKHRRELEALRSQCNPVMVEIQPNSTLEDACNILEYKDAETQYSEIHTSMTSQYVQTDSTENFESPLSTPSVLKTTPVTSDSTPEHLRARACEESLSCVKEEVPSFLERPKNNFTKLLEDIEAAYMRTFHEIHSVWTNILQKLQSEEQSDVKNLQDLMNEHSATFKSLLRDLEHIYTSEFLKSQISSGFSKPICNIEALLTEDESTPLPQELILLQKKLSAPYQEQVLALKEQYTREIESLKLLLAQTKTKAGHFEDSETEGRGLAQIIEERDRWKKVGVALKSLVEELMNYFTICEDEVNNTLLSELAKSCGNTVENNLQAVQKNDIGMNVPEQTLIEETPRCHKDTLKCKRRVHFAPTCMDIKTLMNDEEMLLEYIEEDKDLSTKFRAQLDICLDQLRAEANALLELSMLVNKEAPTVVDLTQELEATKQRVVELEGERISREVITEGFGEQLPPSLSRRLENLSQLQNRARTMLGGRPVSPQDPPHLHLLDELCREGDRLAEEARRQQEDLQQQVESADKQLRATRQFLEEQAAEREQERDEFQQELVKVQEQLRARDRDLAEMQHLSKEVEALEQQSKETLTHHQELMLQKENLQSELSAAVDKIWLLRDVITELETQIELKTQRITTLETDVQELKKMLDEQTTSHQQLTDELESLRSDFGSNDLARHVAHLEEQLICHRMQVEECQPDSKVLHQLKSKIHELETSVEKRTKHLESVNAATSSNSCSSPSEDVSIREQLEIFRCNTPEEIRTNAGTPMSMPSPNTSTTLILPLDEVSRLQERLQRHSRAEEAALKRIRDLEMQLKTSKRNEEETIAERDVLQERVADQLLKISSLEACVDASRHKAEIESQEVYGEMQNKLRTAEESYQEANVALNQKAAEVKKLRALLSRAKEDASAQEKQFALRLACEEEACLAAKKQCEQVKEEWKKFQASFEPCGNLGRYIPIPVLFETLLADKNAQIEALQAKLQSAGLDTEVLEVSRSRSSPHTGEEIGKDKDTAEGVRLVQSGPCVCPKAKATQKSELDDIDENTAGVDGKVQDRIQELKDVDDQQIRLLLAKKEKENESLKKLVADRLKERIKEMRQHLDSKDEVIDVLKQQLAEVSPLQDEVNDLKKRLEKAVNSMTQSDDQSSDVNYLAKEVERLTMELEECHNKVKELTHERDELSTLAKEKGTSSHKSDDEDEKCTYYEEIIKLQSELEDVQEQLKVSESHVKETKSELEAARNECVRLSAKIGVIQPCFKKRLDNQESALGIDELAGEVEKVLETSAQLDTTLLKKLNGRTVHDDASCECPSISLSQIALSENKTSEYVPYEYPPLKQLKPLLENDEAQPIVEIASTSPDLATRDYNIHLQQQIAGLEAQIVQKEKETTRKVQELEAIVMNEKKRFDNLQRALQQEKQHSIELEKKLVTKTKERTVLQEEKDLLFRRLKFNENHLQQVIEVLEMERTKVKNLEEEVLKEKNAVRHLHSVLDLERQRAMVNKQKDAELLQAMRMRLENAEAREIQNISPQPAAALMYASQVPTVPHVSQPVSVSDETVQKLKEKIAKYEVAQIRLQRRLEYAETTAEDERQVARKRLDLEQETVRQLRTDLGLLRAHKDTLESQLSSARDKLCSQQSELDLLNRKVHMLEEAELRQQSRFVAEKKTMKEKSQELQIHLQEHIKELETQLGDSEKKYLELSHLKEDVVQFQNEIIRLQKDLTASQAREMELAKNSETAHTDPKVVESFVQRLQDMNAALDQQERDQSKVAITLGRLVEERKENQTINQNLKQKIDKLTETNEKLISDKMRLQEEKIALQLALAQSKAYLANRAQSASDADELENRVNHLFGKYMRSESYRKALAWQKRYLIIALGGYQRTEAETISRLVHFSDEQCRRNHTRKTKFKSVAIVVIAIHRMRFLVRRWYRGRQIGGTTVLNRPYSESLFNSRLPFFRTGRLAGGGSADGGSTASMSSWSVPVSVGMASLSPPCLDRPSYNFHPRNNERASSTPTMSSHRLADYVDRYDELQHRLGLANHPHPPNV